MRSREFKLLAAATLGCAAVALAAPLELARVIAVLPLALFLPGYALTAAAFGQQPPPLQQRFVLWLALSLAVLALGGLILHFLPGGLNAVSWGVLLVAVVLGAGIVAVRRGAELGPGRRTAGSSRLDFSDGALLWGALLVGATAIAIAWTPVPAKNAVGYTQLWMLPGKGSDSETVQVGVASEELAVTRYRLEVRVGTAARPVFSDITLDPGDVRELDVKPERSLPPGIDVRVTARLFTEDSPKVVYRRVTGWIRGAPGQ